MALPDMTEITNPPMKVGNLRKVGLEVMVLNINNTPVTTPTDAIRMMMRSPTLN